MKILLLGRYGNQLNPYLRPSNQIIARDVLSPAETGQLTSWDAAVLAPSEKQINDAHAWCQAHWELNPVLVCLPPGVDDARLETFNAAGADQVVPLSDAQSPLLNLLLRFAIERHQLRHDLENARQDVQRIVRAHPDGLMLIDQRGDVLAANEKGRAHLTSARERDKEKLNSRSFGESSQERTLMARGQKLTVEAKSTDVKLSTGRCTLLSLRDVTKHKILEEKLQQQRDRARLYFNLADVMFVRLDRQGTVKAINPKAEAVLGYAADDLVGKNWFELVVPEPEREGTRAYFKQAMATTSFLDSVHENEVVTSSGEHRVISWHNTLLRDDFGGPVGTLSSGRDITEERRFAKQLREEISVREAMTELRFNLVQAGNLQELVRQACVTLSSSFPIEKTWLVALQDGRWTTGCAPGCSSLLKDFSPGHMPPCIARLSETDADELIGQEACGCDTCVFRELKEASCAGGHAPRVMKLKYQTGTYGYLGLRIPDNDLGDKLPALLRQIAKDLGMSIWGHMERRHRERYQKSIQDQIRHRDALVSIQQAALTAETPDTFFEQVLTTSQQLFSATRTGWLRFDKGSNTIRLVSARGWTNPSANAVMATEAIQRLMTSTAPLMLVDVEKEGRDCLMRDGVKTAVHVPIGPVGHRRGLLSIQMRDRTTFSSNDAWFLKALGNIFSSFLDEHDTRAELQEARHETEALFDAARAMLHHDQKAAVRRLLDRAGSAFDTDEVTIAPTRGNQIPWDTAQAVFEETKGPCTPEELSELQERMAEERAAICIATSPSSRAVWGEEPSRNLVAAPLWDGTNPFGMLVVRMKRRASNRATNLARSFADLLSASYHQQLALTNLAEQEARLQALIDNAPDAIAIANQDGVVQAWNPKATQLLGWTAEQVVGKTLADIMPSSHATKHIHGFQKLASKAGTPDSPTPREITMTRKDGTTFPSEVVFSIWREGTDTQVAAFIRDISARKDLETQLLHAQRMESLGELSSGVAHDFNNSLTVINSSLGFIREDAAKQPTIMQEVDDALRATAGARDLIDKLLAFSHAQEHAPRNIYVRDWLTDTEKTLRHLLLEDVNLSVHVEGDIGYIFVDRSHFDQILFNLVNNATDAMAGRPNPEIHITASTMPDDPSGQLKLDPERHDGIVVLTVRDTGAGIPADVLQRVFDPFFTTKPRGKGTGLGLATAHGIVTQSGGDITISSVIDEGTTVRILLPRLLENDDAPPRSVRFSGTDDVVTTGQGELVLVVEDEMQVRKQIVRLLREHGYQVLEGRNGLDAIRQVTRSSSPIALLLTDVVMPGASGKDVAIATRIKWPNVQVAYMSGHSADVLSEHDISISENVLIRKPFNPDKLLRKVHELIEQGKTAS